MQKYIDISGKWFTLRKLWIYYNKRQGYMSWMMYKWRKWTTFELINSFFFKIIYIKYYTCITLNMVVWLDWNFLLQ